MIFIFFVFYIETWQLSEKKKIIIKHFRIFTIIEVDRIKYPQLTHTHTLTFTFYYSITFKLYEISCICKIVSYTSSDTGKSENKPILLNCVDVD